MGSPQILGSKAAAAAPFENSPGTVEGLTIWWGVGLFVIEGHLMKEVLFLLVLVSIKTKNRGEGVGWSYEEANDPLALQAPPALSLQ